MFASHAFLPTTFDIPLTLGRKIEFAVLAGKNRDFETKGVDQSPQGDHYLNGKGTGIKGTRRFP